MTCMRLMFKIFMVFFFYGYGDHLDLHVLTHSFPTRRSSDLAERCHRIAILDHGALVADSIRAVKVQFFADPRQGYGFRTDQPRTESIGEERSEEHTSELQSLMRISYAVFCLKKKTQKTTN